VRFLVISGGERNNIEGWFGDSSNVG